MNSATMAAGTARATFAMNLSRISTPCVRVAAIVVSEIMERLSPNMAPETMAPASRAGDKPSGPANAMAMGATAAIVPQLVPTASEIRDETRKSPATMKLSGIATRAKMTAESTAPLALATAAKAPARMKIRHISMMS